MNDPKPLPRRLRCAVLCSILLSITAGGPLAAGPDVATDDPLYAHFLHPPESARPWVWWHWLNGNISAEGAKLDLEWMKRAGIGGVQLFEANLMTPQLVEQPLTYMSPAWQVALRRSVATADSLGIKVTIASSPGWSITGGPWVKPEQAMKKLVWSELEANGGVRLKTLLPAPPDVAGPYQDVHAESVGAKSLRFYRDVAVLAYRIRDPMPMAAPNATSNEGAANTSLLSDRAYSASVTVPFLPEGTAWLQQDLGQVTRIRSVTVGVPGTGGWGAPPPPHGRLEASLDGTVFSPVVDLPAGKTPVRTATFAAVRARYVRLVLSPPTARMDGGEPPPSPGAILPVFGAPPKAYQVSEFRVSDEHRVHRFEEKAGFAAAPDYFQIETVTAEPGMAVPPRDVLDLTANVANGAIDWMPPAGRWRIVRIGYSLTGRQNGPAPVEATGLEVDKLSARHVEDYARTYLARYRAILGSDHMGPKGLGSLLSDSIESGPQNWTEDMPAEFERRRGYSLRPWLPAVTGAVIGSAEETDRFLWDFRQTISELLSENHYGTLGRVARENGLSYFSEALEDHRPQLGDDMDMRRHADVPMGAMWAFPGGGAPKPTYEADILGAASVAHVYGKELVAAESLTAFGQPWAFAPRDMKATVDRAFSLGVNFPIIHTSAHQPFTDDRAPGLALATTLGQYFTRNETWAEQAKSWTDYLARSSYLLRQGRQESDIAYFYGQEAPITGLYGDKLPAEIPTGYGYDFIGADALLNEISSADGQIATRAGSRYRLLVLGGSSSRMTLAVLQKVGQLAAAGVPIVGQRPQGSPSLADDPKAFAALADRIWGSRSKIYPTIAEAALAIGLTPDWQSDAPENSLAILHRRRANDDIYFVSNRQTSASDVTVSFRVAGKTPELWRADSGSREAVPFDLKGDRTSVRLALAGGDAVFVVFRNSAQPPISFSDASRQMDSADIGGPWRVAFQKSRGAPPTHRMATLITWNRTAIPGIRYFSGTATYTTEFQSPPGAFPLKAPVFVDLGDVREIAELSVNGHPVTTLWKPPYRADVSSFLRKGTNRLEVKVTNLWVNRLIGDAQPGGGKVTYTQDVTYSPDAPLRESGLIGPVTLMFPARER